MTGVSKPVVVEPASPGLRMALDYLPLAVFFLVNFLAPAGLVIRLYGIAARHVSPMESPGGLAIARVVVATGAFVAATLVAIVISRVKTGRVSPMLWISGVLVCAFGGLTVWFHDPRFIQMKPTILYTSFAAVLGFGLATGRPLLQGLLGSAYPGLSDNGWSKLTVNWAVFFAAMALLNEVVWRTMSWDFWVGFKLWGAIPLTLLFAFANVPMLMRHGLQAGEAEAPPVN